MIACLMAGIETPGDLTDDEIGHHKDDLLEFLQDELGRAEAGEDHLRQYDDFGTDVFVVVTKRRDKGVPKGVKTVDEQFHWDEREAEVRLGKFPGGEQAYYEVRRVNMRFYPPDYVEDQAAIRQVVAAVTGSEPPLGLGKVHEDSLERRRRDEAIHIYHVKQGDWAFGYTTYNSRDWPERPLEEVPNGYRRKVYVINRDDPEGGPITMVLTITFQTGTADVEEITFREKT